MNIGGIESCVAFVDSFLPHKCFQFGFHDNGRVFKCVVGQDAIEAKLSWSRPINAKPTDPIWRALLYASLLKMGQKKYYLTVGHPQSMSHFYDEEYLPSGQIKFILPSGYMNKEEKSTSILINDIMPVGECYAHAYAYKKILNKGCIVISLGFGTIELGAVSSDGTVIKGSAESFTYGLHKASVIFRKKLFSLGFENPDVRDRDQYHIFDSYLRRVVDENLGVDTGEKPINLIIDGRGLKAKDLQAIANETIEEYSVELKRRVIDYIRSQAFNSTLDIVLTGGGTNYDILVEAIRESCKPYNIEVSVGDKKLARESGAIGLRVIADEVYDGVSGYGVDVGHHNTLFEVETKLESDDINHEATYVKVMPTEVEGVEIGH